MVIDYDCMVEKVKNKRYLGITDENAKRKLMHLVSVFGFNSEDDLYKFVMREPVILTLHESAIGYKISVYQLLFDLKYEQVLDMLTCFPAALNYDVDSDDITSSTSVKAKLKFYSDFFNVDKSELGKMILQCPHLLGMDIISDSPTGFKAKINFYKKTFGISDTEVGKLIKKFPSIIRYDVVANPTGIKEKLAVLHSVGISDQQILEYPYILSTPAKKIRFRYMILSICYTNEQIVKNNYFMIGDGKLYARFRYLSTFNRKTALSAGLCADEKRFQKYFYVASNKLLDEYPLSKDAVNFVEKNYNHTHPGNQLYLNKTEQNSILGVKEPVLVM